MNTPRPPSSTPIAVGLVGLPGLADPFRAAGLAVVGGKDFRGSAGGMNPAGSKQVALPATIDEILSVGGMSALGGVVGTAMVYPDGSVLPSPARTSSPPPSPVPPSVPSSPVEQEADPFADAQPQAPAGRGSPRHILTRLGP